MIVGVVRYRQFTTSAVLAAALTVVRIAPGAAQTQEAAPHEQSPAENNSAAEASKQAANPLASVWLMQFQQNNTWIGMPANGGNRVQSNLQFQPLLSVKLTDDWSLVTRPVLQLFNTTPFQDQAGQSDRVTGFGDTAVAFALSPGHRLVGNWLLAAGPTFIFPTATDSRIGQNTWQVGPAAAIGYMGKDLRNLCVSAAVVFGRRQRPKDPTNDLDLRFCPHLPETDGPLEQIPICWLTGKRPAVIS